ncbi:MAG: permease-like cell division protein FtsX [Pseudomonadota bacterium]|nr:MAG: ABC transporter permease [Pseudomonadota bacterium]
MTPLERAFRGAKSDARLYALGVFSVAVAFVCLAAALLVVVNVKLLYERWGDTGRASVFLRTDTPAAQITALEQALRRTPGVVRVRHVSSEQARAELAGSGRDPLLDALPLEAFPASLELELEPGITAQRIAELKQQLGLLPAVESVETYEAWSERLRALLSAGVAAALLLAVVVLAAVMSVVSSTLRLSLERRRIEVEVLKLVGATDAYVRRPFVLEGAAQGAMGSVLALGLLGLLFAIVRAEADPALFTMLGLEPRFLPWYAAVGLLVLGSLLGAASARIGLRKLLEV